MCVFHSQQSLASEKASVTYCLYHMANNLNITNRSGLAWKHSEHCGIEHEVGKQKWRSVLQIASVKTRNGAPDITEAGSTQLQTG